MPRNPKPFIKKKRAVRPLNLPRIPSGIKKPIDQGLFLLEKISAEDLTKYRTIEKKLQDYFVDEYFYFASERAKRNQQIIEALNKKTTKREFQNFYRCVYAEYTLKPLSCRGSRISSVGGRFNIGTIGNSFSSFGSLYIGENLTTARAEIMQKDGQFTDRVSIEDFAGASVHDYRVHGSLNSVFDLTNPENVKPFLKILSKIELSDDLVDKATSAGLTGMQAVKKMPQLLEALLQPNWRLAIARFGIPSNSQTFGNLVRSAKIEAIRYKSRFGCGECLAIFPENLSSGSFVELSDRSAPGIITRIDSKNYNELL